MNETSMIDLVAGYSAYTTPEELTVSAATDAPATTPVCAATVASAKLSSGYCVSAAASAAGGATYRIGC